MPILEWLPERSRAQIEAAVAAVERSLGDGLIGVCLIGPAARPDSDSRAQPELLIVADELGPETLRTLARALVGPLQAGLQIRTVTDTELRGSVDVHALELAQWRDLNQLLAGRDPFAELDIAAVDLRHEIERALRTLGHRLRNRLLWCLATEQQRLDALLRESLERLVALAQQSLQLLGEPVPDDDEAVLEAFLRWAGAELDGVARLRARLSGEQPAGDPVAELAALAAATEAATAAVDSLMV
ncbi:MAG TPA: hypothetical protein VK034_32440 [Enhygromyxa sp.]|nr:hypothetical protein [Enhygromyxa sp.]